MHQIIKNNLFQVTVKNVGAELCSFKSMSSGIEYIWQADPEVWSGHAPNLFPIIGSLKENSFLYEGKEYACPKHGFIRNNANVLLLDITENSLTYGLKYSEETLQVYPFKFEYQIKYILDRNKLKVQHNITNHGDITMLFSLGGHPGFTCPWIEDEKYSDYYLEFNKPETAESWQVVENGLIGENTQPVFNEPTKINLHPLIFEKDAIVLKNINSSKVALKSKKSNHSISMELNDFPYLGIWAKPNAPYVCIEPWLGIADSVDSDRQFINKEGLIKLDAKKEFTASYSIIISE